MHKLHLFSISINQTTKKLHFEGTIFETERQIFNQMYKTLGILLIIFILFPHQKTFAQKGFSNGYIITNENDTLFGKIKDRKHGTFETIYKKVRWKGDDGKKFKFDAYDVNGYNVDGAEYVSMWFTETTIFLSFSSFSNPNEGKKIFFLRAYSGYLSYYFIEYVEDGRIEKRGYFKRADENELVFVRTGLFGINKKRLISYFNDCEELQSMIESKKITNPYEILEFYNNWKKETPSD